MLLTTKGLVLGFWEGHTIIAGFGSCGCNASFLIINWNGGDNNASTFFPNSGGKFISEGLPAGN